MTRVRWCSDDDGTCRNRACRLNGYTRCRCDRHSRHCINGEWCCARDASIICCRSEERRVEKESAKRWSGCEWEGTGIEGVIRSAFLWSENEGAIRDLVVEDLG